MAGLTAAPIYVEENCNVLLSIKNDRTGGLLSTFESSGFSLILVPGFINSECEAC